MSEYEPRLSDEEAQKVIARALDLQSQSTGALTVAQIREIASDLSIPESAVDQALAEHRAAPRSEGEIVASYAAVSVSRASARPIIVTLMVVGGAVVLLIVLYIIARLFP